MGLRSVPFLVLLFFGGVFLSACGETIPSNQDGLIQESIGAGLPFYWVYLEEDSIQQKTIVWVKYDSLTKDSQGEFLVELEGGLKCPLQEIAWDQEVSDIFSSDFVQPPDPELLGYDQMFYLGQCPMVLAPMTYRLVHQRSNGSKQQLEIRGVSAPKLTLPEKDQAVLLGEKLMVEWNAPNGDDNSLFLVATTRDGAPSRTKIQSISGNKYELDLGKTIFKTLKPGTATIVLTSSYYPWASEILNASVEVVHRSSQTIILK